MARRANSTDIKKYPVGDFISGNFIDDSTNEDSFKIYWDGFVAKSQVHRDYDIALKDYPSGQFDNNIHYNFDKLGTGNKLPFASKRASGELGNLNDLVTKNIEVGVKAENKAGESSKASLGVIAKYNRADFYIYIGSNDLFGSGASSELLKLEGSRGRMLSEALKNALLMNNLKPGSFIKGDWRNADPVLDEDVSAEISFLDYLSGKNNGRDVVVWKLGINNAIASTSFGPSGEGRNLIEQYLNSDFQALYDRFCQPRIAGCIINMRLLDQDIDGAYQNLIDYIRDYLDLPELPIVLTDEEDAAIDESKICFQLDPDNANPDLKDYYAYRGMGGYYGFAEPDCITSPQFWKWNGEYNPSGFTYQYKGWSYRWKKLYNLDLTEPSEVTYIKYTKGERLWRHPVYWHPDSSIFYHEHGENNFNVSEYDKIFGYPSDVVNALRNVGANGFLNYADPTRQNQNFFSNIAFMYSKKDGGTIGTRADTESYYEFPTVYGSSEILESHVYQDQYIEQIQQSDYIWTKVTFLLPFLKRLAVPNRNNTDPDLEIHSYYNKYKHLMLPYVSGTRNFAGARGIRTLESVPSKLFNIIRRNKKVRYVRRDLLPLDGTTLTTEGQVTLGQQYAKVVESIHRKSSINGIDFTLRFDATTGSFTNIGQTGWENQPSQLTFEEVRGETNSPFYEGRFMGRQDPEKYIISENFNYDGNIDGKPAFRFVNQSFWLPADQVFSNVRHKYIFMVIKPNANVQGKVFLETGNNARTLCHFPWDNLAIFDFRNDGLARRVKIYDFFVETKPYIVTCAFDASRNFALMRANGIEYRRNFNEGHGVTSPIGRDFFIGGVPDGNYTYYQWAIDADIGEFMTVDKSIGMDGILAVEDYLSNKWEIQV